MKVFAPAKVNLALHVTGRRADGYHLLDSLVVFADVGDHLSINAADRLTLRIAGPCAQGVPNGAENLIWRAARLLDPDRGAAIVLEKYLPHAGGVGGGSADAAAALRGLSAVWGMDLPDTDAILKLGADVPACLYGWPCRMSGIGGHIENIPPLPPLWMVLVNPCVTLPTGDVFARMSHADNPPMPSPRWKGLDDFLTWLCATRNDLTAPARAIVPTIDKVLGHLTAQAGCLLSRMTGSGATCFGLFADLEAAQIAAQHIQRAEPSWWMRAAKIL